MTGKQQQQVVLVLMGTHGFSARRIAKELGISENAVYLRLRRNKIRLFDYRHGKTTVSREHITQLLTKTRRAKKWATSQNTSRAANLHQLI